MTATRPQLTYANITATLALVAALGGGAWAVAGPAREFATSPLIRACVKKADGSMRKVGAKQRCRTAESPITWNRQGLQGPQGQQGAPGPQGLAAASDARFGTNTSQAAAGNGATCTLGSIALTAGTTAGGTPAQGQMLLINNNTALFALLGTRYGGDGQTTFALPDLRGAAPNGLTYSICILGVFPV
jgi:hypothetical protein